jgi:hypothetical protein
MGTDTGIIPYAEFIARRKPKTADLGPTITADQLHESLKPFQAEITIWAAKVGRAAQDAHAARMGAGRR